MIWGVHILGPTVCMYVCMCAYVCMYVLMYMYVCMYVWGLMVRSWAHDPWVMGWSPTTRR